MSLNSLPPIKRGQVLTVRLLNEIVSRTIRSIFGGRGIAVQQMPGRIIISSTQHTARTTRVGVDTGLPYLGHYDTVGELPTATEPCFATVGANYKLYYGRVGVAWGCISDIV